MQPVNRKNLVHHFAALVGSVQTVYKERFFHYLKMQESAI